MKKRILLDLILNIIIVLSVGIGMTLHILLGLSSGMDGEGLEAFRYFTNLSNIFCGLIAFIFVIIEIKMLIQKKDDAFSPILMGLRQVTLAGVGVTFITVTFIFLPLVHFDFDMLYSGQKIMTHFTTPILASLSFIFFAKGNSFNWKSNFFSIIPEFIYSLVYEIEVPLLGNWDDFYGFTLGGRWYAPFIVIPTICLITYGLSILVSFLHHKVAK